MVELISDVDGQLLDRLDSCAAFLGASRTEIVERALSHYLDHAEALELQGHGPQAHADSLVDWGRAKAVLVGSHCSFSNCPHHGECPIELCPL